MSRKKRNFSTEFKTKLVLEVLKNDKTLNEIASENNITPKNLQNWKKIFLENAEVAMEPARAVSEYKQANTDLQEKIDEYARTVGKMTVELEWMQGKLKSLGLSNKKELVEPKLKDISITRQCQLINLNRSSLYYKPKINKTKEELKNHIQTIFANISSYGYLKVHQQLLEDGYSISANSVAKYRKELGLRAILSVKPINTTQQNKEHKKYSYKLKGINITNANQVWSTDITYIKTNIGMVYLAAIIDWHSKAVLTHRISNTMDTTLVMDVLNEALNKYGKPKIFNTDQGSQYTSHIHTQTLIDNDITISMDSKGRATDNICIERFWRSAKCEKIYLNEYNSMKQLKDDINDYIDFYNNQRFHQTLNYNKPMEVYKKSIQVNNIDYQIVDQIRA